MLGISGLAIAVAAIVLVVANPFGRGSGASGLVDNSFPTGVATVERRSLSSQTQVSATLGFANPSTISVPAGTAPSDVVSAHQAVTADADAVQAAEATLATDDDALSQLRASLSAATAKQAVDCAGVNAAGARVERGTGRCARDRRARRAASCDPRGAALADRGAPDALTRGRAGQEDEGSRRTPEMSVSAASAGTWRFRSPG
jgi:hypothetical protein